MTYAARQTLVAVPRQAHKGTRERQSKAKSPIPEENEFNAGNVEAQAKSLAARERLLKKQEREVNEQSLQMGTLKSLVNKLEEDIRNLRDENRILRLTTTAQCGPINQKENDGTPLQPNVSAHRQHSAPNPSTQGLHPSPAPIPYPQQADLTGTILNVRVFEKVIEMEQYLKQVHNKASPIQPQNAPNHCQCCDQYHPERSGWSRPHTHQWSQSDWRQPQDRNYWRARTDYRRMNSTN